MSSATESQEKSLMQRVLGVPVDIKVSNYQVLVRAFQYPTKLSSGLLMLPDSVKKLEKHLRIGLVLGMGDLAYQDKAKFPTGPWCQIGDWVHYSVYERTDITVYGTIQDNEGKSLESEHSCWYIPDMGIQGVIPPEMLAHLIPQYKTYVGGTNFDFQSTSKD